MDKEQIIEDILSHLAIKSKDGFLGGFDLSENVELLKKTLEEYGLSEEDIRSVMEKTLKDKEKLGVKKVKTLPTADADWSKGDVSAESLRRKNIPEDKIEKIIEFFKSKDSATEVQDKWTRDEEEFLKRFNKLTPSQAADYMGTLYTSRVTLHDDEHIIGFLDSNFLKGSSAIGRGEYPLLFLMKDAETGRSESGDLKVGGQVIDVKESVGGVFKVEDNTFKNRGFNKLKIVEAMNELELFIRRKKENYEALLNLLKKMNDKGKLTEKEFKYAVAYFEAPTKESFGVNTFNALIKCRGYFKAMGDEEKIEAIANVADFKISGKEVEVAIDIPDKSSQNTIENPPEEKTPVNIEVQAIEDKERGIIIPQILNLIMFSDDTLTPEDVGKNILPELDYNGIIIINKVGTDASKKITWVEYIEDLTNTSGWAFYSYSKGIKFKKIGS